jgi:hypothetical protein
MLAPELRHRGAPLVEYPAADLWKAVGDDDIAALRDSEN